MSTTEAMLYALKYVKTEDGFIDFIEHICRPINNANGQDGLRPYQKVWAREMFRGFTPCKKTGYPLFDVLFPRQSEKICLVPHYCIIRNNEGQDMSMMQGYKLRVKHSHVNRFQFDPPTSDDCRFRSNSYRLFCTVLRCMRMRFSMVVLWSFSDTDVEYMKRNYQELLERTSLLKITEDSFTWSTKCHRNIWQMKKDAIMK